MPHSRGTFHCHLTGCYVHKQHPRPQQTISPCFAVPCPTTLLFLRPKPSVMACVTFTDELKGFTAHLMSRPKAQRDADCGNYLACACTGLFWSCRPLAQKPQCGMWHKAYVIMRLMCDFRCWNILWLCFAVITRAKVNHCASPRVSRIRLIPISVSWEFL